MGMFAICISFAYFMTAAAKGQWFELPSFVWALMCGVVLRNILEHGLKVQVFDRCIDVFGNASLVLFLAMALMSLQLWLLADLADYLDCSNTVLSTLFVLCDFSCDG